MLIKNNEQKFIALQNIVKNVSRETFFKLLAYEEQIIKWQNHINLISNNDLDFLWERHFLDSAQLLACISSAEQIIDIGSGGGFPSLVLAILLSDKNNQDNICRFDLIEKLKKKCVFLHNVVATLNLDVNINNCLIEDYCRTAIIKNNIIITSRAFAELDKILAITSPLFIARKVKAILPKGENYNKELQKAKANWNFDLNILPSKIRQGSVILEITNLKAK